MMRKNIYIPGYIIVLLVFTILSCNAQTLEEVAAAKMDTLEILIGEAEDLGIDAHKEKMTIRTAEVFLKYANWDENNTALNESYFELVSIYKDNAAQLAADLPDFERNDVINMLDEAIEYLGLLVHGDFVRKPIPIVDWSAISLDEDQLTFNERPVFLADYTWKPNIPELTDYFGELDGFFLTSNYVTDETGTIKTNISNDLNSKPSGTTGFVFINHKNLPQWIKDKYPGIDTITGEPFTAYDIDHPGARELYALLIAGTVPKMAGKKYTQLGYMLANEPRWVTYKNGTQKVWYTGGVSAYTMEKFKTWLAETHDSIEHLNFVWGSDFPDFSSVTLDIPIDISMQGTAQWYDWNMFNDQRVTDWFTWMKEEIRKSDPAARVHIKIMPSFFTESKPCTGIDLEALSEISDIIGNDVAAKNNVMFGESPWDNYYAYDWRELYMSYDFLKSVSPDQIIFNSESHLLSTSKSRDLYQDPAYARAIFWGAHTLGLSASQIWYWPRREDGSLRSHDMKAYPGSNNQQPRLTNEIHSTMMDLNSFSEEILEMQRQRKPLRIFYSKTSSHNSLDYMDDIFELYEDLNFEGISLGFATRNIIMKQNNENWDAILVYKTENVREDELIALQSYLDNGGTVIIDEQSLKKNEYGNTLAALEQSGGTLLHVNSLSEMKSKAIDLIEDKGLLPEVSILESNTGGHKGCTWKCVKNSDGNNVLSIINMGKTDATLEISLKNAEYGTICIDLLKGDTVSSEPVLKPYEVYFVELMAAAHVDTSTVDLNVPHSRHVSIYPVPSEGEYFVEFGDVQAEIELMVIGSDGSLVKSSLYRDQAHISDNITALPNGLYFIRTVTNNQSQTLRMIKN